MAVAAVAQGLAHRVGQRLAGLQVEPDVVGQVGRTQRLVAGAVGHVAGGTHRGEGGRATLGALGVIGVAGEREHVLGDVLDVLLAELLPGGHQAVAAVVEGRQDVLRLATVEPLVVGQVGEAVAALGTGAVADRAVVEVDALGHLHRLGVLGELRDRHLLVLGEDRREALLGALDLLFPLALLAPAQHAGEVAEAGVEHQVAQREDHGADVELEPPARQRVVVLLDAVGGVAGGVDVTLGIRGLVGLAVGVEQPEGNPDGAQRDDDDPGAPEAGKGVTPKIVHVFLSPLCLRESAPFGEALVSRFGCSSSSAKGRLAASSKSGLRRFE